MQKLDLVNESFISMNTFIEAPAEDVIGIDKRITIVPEWDALVRPVEGLARFDYSQPVPPILVNLQDGQLVVLDGRKRFLAYKKCNRRIPFSTTTYSRRRAKDEFLQRHVLLDKEAE